MEQIIAKSLSCLYFFHNMYPPIRQCRNGHHLCPECFRKIKVCPKCNAKKNQFTRNYELEAAHALLTVNCRYKLDGCGFTSLGIYINIHQETCRFGRIPCPMKTLNGCTKTGSRLSLAEHLQTIHSEHYEVGKEKLITIENLENVLSLRNYLVLFAFSDLFRITYDIEDSCEEEGMSRWAVHYIGVAEEAQTKHYSYKIEILRSFEERNSSTTSLIYQSKVVVEKELLNLDIENSAIFVKHRHLSVPRTVLNEYCVDGHLKVAITIYNNDGINIKTLFDQFDKLHF